MFDSILTNNTGLEFQDVMICILTALALGFLVSFLYMKTEKRPSKNFAVSMVLLPPLVCAVISTINGSLGTGIAIMGAFSLVRFRSQAGTSRSLVLVFFDMAIGLAAATGYLFFTVSLGILIGAIYAVLTLTGYGVKKGGTEKRLRIEIPEDLEYEGVFDDIFEKYFSFWTKESVKTSDLGSIFELKYTVVLRENVSEKELIDALRVRNGNLQISLNVQKEDREEL